MKHVLAIVLLCLPTQLSAAERCSQPRANRDEIVRIGAPRPAIVRPEIGRPPKARLPANWQRVLLFEQQIL